jgi:HSP20 family protein
MAEIAVKKELERERTEVLPWFDFETPWFRGFGVRPFALLRHFREEMDRIFGTGTGWAPVETIWRPAIEMKQEKGTLRVTAELPGLAKEDVKVTVTGDVLAIEGERKKEKEEKREGYFHSERSYGRFYRSIPLPEGASLEKAAANFNNGVLEVTVPIPEVREKTTNIPVTAGEAASATTH